ncbi:sodium:solute symporter family protein [Criblamydia sequanensis]|uniref:Sodium/solute symporter n=1 Tax=Candidatus Criblamydia sequanensis CRIB-18 TaxID=1437425 RepID=A0A090CY43_9BACT|nr:sodium:solute symporter family protein [Criblamydia sequanensis]CDR33136.1 Sodium/solute symporter [Criblamydia sequanensis CRIB-18]
MNISIFIFCIFLLQFVCFWVSRKSFEALATKEDYFLAGRALRFFPLAMTFIATQVGGGLVLGASEEAYQFGWTVLLYPLGASLGLFLLGSSIGMRLASFPVTTVAQIFETAYGSKRLKEIASFLSVLSLFMIFVAQLIASKKLMVMLGVESNLLFILFWAIVISYTAMGGFKAVVATDMVQASFFIVIFIIAFLASFFGKAAPLLNEGLLPEANLTGASKLLGWIFMPLLFMLIEQDMAQRCFAAASPKVIRKASLFAALSTFLISLIPIYFGTLAREIGVAPKENGSILVEMIQLTTNPWITALAGAAILAAIISTADSLINAITSNLSQDFEIFAKKFENLKFSKITTALLASLGLFISFYFDNIVDLLIQSYELSVYCLFIPILMALFKPRGNKLSAALAILFGALAFVFCKIIAIPFLPKEIACLFSSSIGFLIGEYLSSLKKEAIKIG